MAKKHRVFHKIPQSVRRAETYFEKFYAHCSDEVSEYHYAVMGYPDKLMGKMKQELSKYNASIKMTKNRTSYLLRFVDERSHLLFIMRWA